MGNLFASPGLLMPRATYSGTTYPEPVWASMRVYEKTIAINGFSMPMPIDIAGQAFSLVIKYVTAPTTTTTIEIATDPTFADAQTLDTVPAAASKANFWSSSQGVHYQGFIRVKNTSDAVVASVYGQEIVNSTGGVLV